MEDCGGTSSGSCQCAQDPSAYEGKFCGCCKSGACHEQCFTRFIKNKMCSERGTCACAESVLNGGRPKSDTEKGEKCKVEFNFLMSSYDN